MRARVVRSAKRFRDFLTGARVMLPTWQRRTLKVAVVLPLFALVSFLGFVQFSNQPRFCISCHYMKPFYDAWAKSSHNHVKCVDCHIPPGAKNWLQHKMAAANQVVRYVTRQYGMRPWVEVDDKSCLRSGCHETRLLAGKVQFGGVTFDHGPHLTSFRRVTRLRCTSCHAQIVQGAHMTVTEGTCFLCHFKNTKAEPDMARCNRCHEDIKPHKRTDISAEAWVEELPESGHQLDVPKYDHQEVKERSVDCRFCHSNVVQGNGEVPRDRCLTCHLEPERLERFDDTEFMHRHHVTEHKVDCMRCHVEIQHHLPPPEETPKLDCASCHPDQHESTRQLYRGDGAAEVGAKPNPMFDVRVPCEGCHLDHKPVDGKRITTRATAAGCMMCHGEKYGRDLAQWRAEAASWTAWAEDSLARAEASLRDTGAGDAALRPLATARDHVRLVSGGHFVHNPNYAKKLLRQARTQANQALAKAGAGYRWPPEPKPIDVRHAETACADCHTDIVSRQGFVYGTVFEHSVHVGEANISCLACHTAGNQPQAKGHGKLAIDRTACRTCHAQNRIDSPHEPGWRQMHGGAAKHDSGSCLTCHAQSTCDSCHGTRIPHAADWVTKHRGTKNTQTCAKCHGQSFCSACHGVNLPHSAEFRRGGHGREVARDPAACARCHEPNDCQSCHAKKPPANHVAPGWDKRHGPAGQRQAQKCALCHGNDSCQRCHQVTMPHAPDWTLHGHAAVAAKKPAACRRCHQTSYCAQCHVGEPGKKP